jgi:hypothetical protein
MIVIAGFFANTRRMKQENHAQENNSAIVDRWIREVYAKMGKCSKIKE